MQSADKQKPSDRKKGYMEKIAEAMDVPGNTLIGVPRIEVAGFREMLIENHRGILEYSDDVIRINCEKMVIRVEGQNLVLKAMNASELSLSGDIRKIEYIM